MKLDQRQVVLFLISICLFQSVTGDAPGDEDDLCHEEDGSNNTVILLDSHNYVNLISGVTGVFPPPVWKTQSYQPGDDGWTMNSTSEICQQALQVCDFRNDPGVGNWLFTQYIEYLDAKEVHIEVRYNLSLCYNRRYSCSESYLYLYYHQTNGSRPEEQTEYANYDYIGRFNWYNFIYTTQIQRSISDEGFYLGFQDRGTCGSITRVRVYYKVCPSKVDGLTFYPSLPLPAENSQEPNIAYAYCAYNSYNSLASGYKAYSNGRCEYGARCECRLGYEEVTTGTDKRCQVCSRGRYRSASDTSCRSCPSNTVRSGVAAAECRCQTNYYRAPNEGPSYGCTTPPSACRNLAVSNSSTYNQVTVNWTRPSSTGRSDFYYNIYYSSSEEDGKFTQHNTQRYFMSRNQVSYTLSDLSPFTSYTIRVTVHNGVSDQDPAGEASRRCEVTTTTLPNDVAQLDILSGLALWNVTNDSTQYQIRYNRTEGRNHGNSDIPLEVYYDIIDNKANYTVQVRSRNQNGLGYWSTPIIVRFKARRTSTGLDSSSEMSLQQSTTCLSTELFNSTTYYYYDYFDDSENISDSCAASIERITIDHGAYVESIQVAYRLTSGTTFYAPRNGRAYGSGTTINFAEGEEIVAITGGWNNNGRLVQFKFITMRANGVHHVYGPYGWRSAYGRFAVNANVVSFFGHASTSYIYGLGFKYRQSELN